MASCIKSPNGKIILISLRSPQAEVKKARATNPRPMLRAKARARAVAVKYVKYSYGAHKSM